MDFKNIPIGPERAGEVFRSPQRGTVAIKVADSFRVECLAHNAWVEVLDKSRAKKLTFWPWLWCDGHRDRQPAKPA